MVCERCCLVAKGLVFSHRDTRPMEYGGVPAASQQEAAATTTSTGMAFKL